MDAISLMPLLFLGVLFFSTFRFLDWLNPAYLDEQEDFMEDVLNPELGVQMLPSWSHADEALSAVA
ncbi:MAG: hypothetical protein EBZ67_08355 [Chitinophagia bacterium]|nr:hypothetical protein [Chitinophagia bacterium]